MPMPSDLGPRMTVLGGDGQAKTSRCELSPAPPPAVITPPPGIAAASTLLSGGRLTPSRENGQLILDRDLVQRRDRSVEQPDDPGQPEE